MIKSLSDLDIFKLSYSAAMDIFNTSKLFPKEEKYSLTDQVIRSSRSITANIAEGWGKGHMRMSSKNIWYMPWAPWKSQNYGYFLQRIATI